MQRERERGTLGRHAPGISSVRREKVKGYWTLQTTGGGEKCII